MARITDRRDVAFDLETVERFIELIPAPVTVLDDDGRSLMVNQAYHEALRLTPEMIKSRTLTDALHLDDVNAAQQVIAEAIEHHTGTADLRLKDVHGRYLDYRWKLLHDPEVGIIIATATDRTAEQERLADAERRATTDHLTGLLSRAGLMEDLERRTADGDDRDDGHAGDDRVVIALLDVDGFKGINDHLGHLVGDQVLCVVADRLGRAVPAGASVSRLGGDEFVVACSAADVTPDQLAVAVRAAFELPFELPGHQRTIGVSIGLCTSDGVSSVDDLLRRADIALYEAKRSGGFGAQLATEELVSAWDRVRETEQALLAALGTGEFVPYFQPVVEIPSGEHRGYEVLLRWVRPNGTVVPAQDFIDIADQAGLLGPMSAESRRRAFAAIEPGTHIGFNVSAAELLDPDFAVEMSDLVRTYDLDSTRLVIEITEQTALRDLDRAARILGRLRSIGFRIALDDFGSGYSSLTYVTELPIDIVKLDRYFVRAAAASDRGRQVLTAMSGFLKQLDLMVVVEGVEDQNDHALVCELGVDMAQGWFYGRPAPLDRWADQR